jgi:hypothetical protein
MIDDPVRLGNMPQGLAFMTFYPPDGLSDDSRKLVTQGNKSRLTRLWLQRAENAPAAQHQRGERDEAGGSPRGRVQLARSVNNLPNPEVIGAKVGAVRRWRKNEVAALRCHEHLFRRLGGRQSARAARRLA